LSIKDVPVREEGVVQCGHFADKEGGALQVRTSSVFDAKNVCTNKGIESVRTREEESIFRDFVQTSLVDGSL